jgi:hypothetical protein
MCSTDVKIKAGPELDLAVAEAVGLAVVGGGIDDDEVWVVNADTVTSGLFHPSRDLNAAFAAAAKAGLFDPDGPEAHLSCHPAAEETWKVWWEDSSWPDGGCAVYEPTPALAICAAILRLKSEVEP